MQDSKEKQGLSLSERLKRMQPQENTQFIKYHYGVDFHPQENVNQFMDSAKKLYKGNNFERTNRTESQDWSSDDS